MALTGVPNPRKGRAGNNGIRRDDIGNLVRNGCGEAIRKVAARHESADMQAVYTDITQDMIDGKYGAQMLDSVAVRNMMDRRNPDRIKSSQVKTRRRRIGQRKKVDCY
jgi:hypothetical protein